MAANIETAIVKILNDDPVLTGLVGERVRSGVAWQEDVLPYIVCTLTDDAEQYHLGGTTNLAHAQIDVDCWAETAPSSHTVAQASRNVLNNYRGTVLTNGDSTQIRTVRLESRRRELELEIEGSDTFIRGVGLTFTIWYFKE